MAASSLVTLVGMLNMVQWRMGMPSERESGSSMMIT
jgi:hypothetical protein